MRQHNVLTDQSGFTLLEMSFVMLTMSIVLIMAASFLVRTEASTSRIDYRTAFNDTADLAARAISIEVRSSSIVSPTPCTTSTCTATASVILLEQTGLSSQTCEEWIATGSPLALKTGSWVLGAVRATNLRTVAYLSSGSSTPFTATQTSGLAELTYSMSVMSVASTTKLPAAVQAVPLTDTVAARNTYTGSKTC